MHRMVYSFWFLRPPSRPCFGMIFLEYKLIQIQYDNGKDFPCNFYQLSRFVPVHSALFLLSIEHRKVSL